MARFALKVFYLGQKYQGFQRQPSGMAIENYLEYALISGNYIRSFKDNNYQGASRTDAGVSALCNVIAFNTEKTPNLDEINSYLPKDRSILVHRYTKVNDDFLPRSKNYKVYEYWLPPSYELYNPNRLFDYQGEHDFSSMIKSDGAGAYNPITKISNIEMNTKEKWIQIRITGDSFGREQIRRMIGLLLAEKFNDIQISTILSSDNLHIPSAPAQFLFLSDINYNMKLNWVASKNLIHFIETIKHENLATLQSIIINDIIIDLLQSS